MRTIMHNMFVKLTVALLLITAMLGLGLNQSVAYAACTPTVTFDLYAKTGSATLFGATTVTIWGYSSTSGGTASIPGPVLDVAQGDCVGVNLHNVNIPGSTALLFQGQSLAPDTAGVSAGGTQSYSFTAGNPGTFLYEAGLTPNGQHQVAMGMYGALIVRPATAGQAYNSASTAFDEEAVVMLSEFDTTLAANPTTFDMRNYKPKYFLINGKAYPGTSSIPATAGNDLLLRYVNAGLQSHSMSLLGFSQRAVATDGNLFGYSYSIASETIAPGATLDAIVSIPVSIAGGSRFALYDASLMLRNNTGLNTFAGFGGMLTFMDVGTSSGPGPDTTGPSTSSVSLPSGAVAGAVNVGLSASVSDVSTGNSNVTAAEYFVDTTGANGSGAAMSGSFGSPGPVSVTATIPSGVVGTLSTGNHTVYVHGQDSAGNWGPFALGVLKIDDTGPNTTTLGLSPNSSNGTVNASLSGTGNDTSTGNSNITAAEYFIDSIGANGSGAAMSVNIASPTASVSATISAATINAVSDGAHNVYVHSQDALGNWGPTSVIVLNVDKTGPSAIATAAPNPNNGTNPLSSSVQAVRVTGTFTDLASNIAAAELFIDTIGTSGTGAAFIATDGVFNSLGESGYSDIPLAVVNSLTSGNHTIYVHGKDSAGNWGSMFSVTLVIDRTPPTITSINRVNPDPTTAASVDFLVTFSESVTGVTSSNFGLATTGSLTGASITSVTGTGAARTVTVSTGTGAGTLGLNLTSATNIKDVAGNAMTSTGLPFVGQAYTISAVSDNLYFSTFGNTNPPGLGGTADNADIYFWNSSVFSRPFDATAFGVPGIANADGFDRVSATSFYMSFNAATTISIPGPNLAVQDEDIVFFNGGAWTLYFDGSANGLTSASFDLDAISVVGAGGPGNIYFSTDNASVPPGAGGTGDDADIYRWNGGSSYTRIYDASALGWSTTNVDGFVWVDATHFYISYSVDTTVPVLGAVQDEDVLYYNAGVWSVYFNGTAHGLTNANHDVDAFDLP